MTKLLKSILLATASVGAVAGSTAAVISCGTSSNQESIDSFIKSLANEKPGFDKDDLADKPTFTKYIQTDLDIDLSIDLLGSFKNIDHVELNPATDVQVVINGTDTAITYASGPGTPTTNSFSDGNVVQFKISLIFHMKDSTKVTKDGIALYLTYDLIT